MHPALVEDMEIGLMKYCLWIKGKWWATRLFRNHQVDDLYKRLRKKSDDEIHRLIMSMPVQLQWPWHDF